nr:MAG TPA: hypothetical protein [Caudoviricetes sp.]
MTFSFLVAVLLMYYNRNYRNQYLNYLEPPANPQL